jgi:hypothetical protein
VAKRPDGAMLLYHLGQDHRGQVGPYLRRMETEDIATIMLELFDLVEGEGNPPRQRSVTSDALTDLATGKVSLAQAKESPPCLSNTSCCERRRRMVRLPA